MQGIIRTLHRAPEPDRVQRGGRLPPLECVGINTAAHVQVVIQAFESRYRHQGKHQRISRSATKTSEFRAGSREVLNSRLTANAGWKDSDMSTDRMRFAKQVAIVLYTFYRLQSGSWFKRRAIYTRAQKLVEPPLLSPQPISNVRRECHEPLSQIHLQLIQGHRRKRHRRLVVRTFVAQTFRRVCAPAVLRCLNLQLRG